MMLVFVMTAKYLIQINWLQKLALFALTGPSQPLDFPCMDWIWTFNGPKTQLPRTLNLTQPAFSHISLTQTHYSPFHKIKGEYIT